MNSFTDLRPPLPGLSALKGQFKAIVCDVWGVLHNGKIGYPAAGEALTRWREDTATPVVLLTNAPRPAAMVARLLEGYGIGPEAYDAIVTSGDVSRGMITSSGFTNVFHLGPQRDTGIYEGLDIELKPEEEADIIVCTGLYDDDTDKPEDYRPLFERTIQRGLSMICANPDIVVERGHELIWCAGALARVYEEMGGTTLIIGKPYPSVYEAALREAGLRAGEDLHPEQVLAIGDGLPTDIKGACGFGLSPLFITAGIHAQDFGEVDAPNPELVAKRLGDEGFDVTGYMPRLKW